MEPVSCCDLVTGKSIGRTAFKIWLTSEDGNSVIVVFQCDTLDRAQTIAANPVVENGMCAAGIISRPNFNSCRIPDR